MSKGKRRRALDKAPEPQPIRSRALDAFSNVLARLGAGTPNLLEGTEYSLQRMSRDFNTLNALYRESWIVRRIIDVIPADMLKNWITITSGLDPDVEKRLSLTLRRTQLIDKIKRGMQWGRLYGGALGVMLVKHQGYDLSQPLQLDWIMPGDFAGLLIFDRWNGVNPSSELIEDISDPDYGFPKYYTVTDPAGGGSVKIHHSRVVRFTGNTLPFWEEIAEMQWGASVVESIFDELRKRDNVSWNIAQLTFMANIRVLKMQDLGQLLAATDNESQAELLRTLEAQNMLLNNMGMQVMDAADGLETHQYTFGGLADCYQQFIMDISGAAEIPVTRLFGRSPSGLNATGESDLQNYYDMIAEKQESYLRPILNKVLPPFIISTLGSLPDDFDFEFDPVAEPTDKERADLAKCGTDNVVAAYNAGLISQRTALKELKQQSERTGVWTNITDEDIERASDSVEPPGEMGGMFGGEEPIEPQASASVRQVKSADAAFWSEADDFNSHHSPENGRFCEADGVGGGAERTNNLQESKKNGTISTKETIAPEWFIKQNRPLLMNAEIKQLGHVRWISKHVFDRMWERGINAEEIKDTIKNGERAVDNQYGGYIYSSNGIKVCVTKSGGLKTVINKSTQNFKTSLGAIFLEAKNAKKTN
ncbi:anti-CBASS protein Acb1 family protein [Phascolarctobacterium succinatutens]|uniref:anti-CBASS protein Acb1 family protein n=1 Tax=Phascolarctobacterium succinatutens TaxID=626940 RepID=UPI0026ED9091|nr:anti-CBASS Acb1 family protein [Phascolarctobacterium succinatutens]